MPTWSTSYGLIRSLFASWRDSSQCCHAEGMIEVRRGLISISDPERLIREAKDGIGLEQAD